MVVGDARLLASAGSGVKVKTVTGPSEALDVFPTALPVLDTPLLSPVIAGQPSSTHAAQIIRCIETGAGLALSGAVSGLVTAPIAKAPLYAAGFRSGNQTTIAFSLVFDFGIAGFGGAPLYLFTFPIDGRGRVPESNAIASEGGSKSQAPPRTAPGPSGDTGLGPRPAGAASSIRCPPWSSSSPM